MPHDIVDKFSTHLKNVLTRALCFVVEMNAKTIEPEHLLWALGTQRGSIGAEILKKAGLKQTELRALIGATECVRMDVNGTDATLRLSTDAKRIVEKAVLTANIYGHRYVGTEHLLSGILQVQSERINDFFAKQKTNLKELREQLSMVLKSTSKFPDMTTAIAKDETQTTVQEEEREKLAALHFFGREITTLEAQKQIDPVIGREAEIDRLMRVLCRRTKNNPLLTGAPGVGKTAIVEGLAKRIVEGRVPSVLAHRRIFAIDMALMVAGTMYRGEFEGRLRQVIEEVKNNDDIVLFIDEIHSIVGAGSASGSMDAANILKPALARGDIRCIGATTPDEYKRHIESDSALERRFQTILVEEPTAEDTQQILEGVAPYYEAFHRVRIMPEAISRALELSVRHLNDRQLPDKAIDLLDEACAHVRIAQDQPTPVRQRRLLEEDLKRVRDTKRQAVVEERFEDAMELKEEEERVRRSLALADGKTETLLFPAVLGRHIEEVVSRMTGIPLQELAGHSELSLPELSARLRARVFGQDHIVEPVASALLRAKSGVTHPKRPLASFLFAGPSGVGKTELARAIAEVFFHERKNLVRLDMSEYAEGFTVSKLIGSPAGYVGYKDQSNLTDRVKQRPYSVVLFDELEKAHPDVQNLLLQILEEGELTDATGRAVNFKNTIVVMTTNVGLERFENNGIGFSGSDAQNKTALTQDIRKELEERFRPELINRFETTCLFQPLTSDTLLLIIEKELKELARRLFESHAVELTVKPGLEKHLVSLLDRKLGARSVRQIVQQNIETKIAERLSKKDRPNMLILRLHRDGIQVVKPRT